MSRVATDIRYSLHTHGCRAAIGEYAAPTPNLSLGAPDHPMYTISYIGELTINVDLPNEQPNALCPECVPLSSASSCRILTRDLHKRSPTKLLGTRPQFSPSHAHRQLRGEPKLESWDPQSPHLGRLLVMSVGKSPKVKGARSRSGVGHFGIAVKSAPP